MRRVLTALGSVALLGVAGVALTLGVAALYSAEGERIVIQWTYVNDEPPPDWAWREARRFLWLANRLDPLNPAVQTNIARLYELKVGKEADLGSERGATWEQALRHYRRAIALRPAWPYAWADLAQTKLKRGRFDAELALAMEQATSLGPWEPGVQLTIASQGVRVWDELPDGLRDIVRSTIQRGVERDWKPIVTLAQQQRTSTKESDEAR